MVNGEEEIGSNASPSDEFVVQLELSPVPLYKNEKNLSFVSHQMEKLNFYLNMFYKSFHGEKLIKW